MPSNVFSSSLNDLGQWLLANQPNYSPQGYNPNAVSPAANFNLSAGSGPPAPTVGSTNEQLPSMPVSTYAPPQGTAMAAPFKNTPTAGDGGGGGGGGGGMGGGGGRGMGGGGGIPGGTGYGSPYSVETGDTSGWAGDGGGAGGAGGMGGANRAQSAVGSAFSGISEALTKAGNAISGVNTMPTPVQSGPFPTINQYAPMLPQRRTQQPPGYYQ